MKNSPLYMFTALNTGLKIPFALDKFSGAIPVGKTDGAGTILYGVGIPHTGIYVQETLAQVNELVNAWFQVNGPGVVGRA